MKLDIVCQGGGDGSKRWKSGHDEPVVTFPLFDWDTPQKCQLTPGFCMLNFSIAGVPRSPGKCQKSLCLSVFHFNIQTIDMNTIVIFFINFVLPGLLSYSIYSGLARVGSG